MNRKMETTSALVPKTIDASPRKSFFISLLTRDIELSSCVLDLIDNSIDGIIQKSWVDISNMTSESAENNEPLSNYIINVELTENHFVIKDNGSGISEEILTDYAFRFWAWEWDNHSDTYNWLSVFWIWMKRAFFKIGKKILLNTKTQSECITVELDVDEWEKDEKRTINYEKTTNPTSETGTEIIITQLNKDIIHQIRDKDYMKDRIVKLLTMSYPLFISAWLQITINSILIEDKLPKIIKEDKYYTVREEKNFNGSDVDLKIVAGFIKSGNPEKTDTEDTGWFVFCNSRNVLYADKDYTTWWGMRSMRKFHSSINPFIGYVFFTSKKEKNLPRNTTKDGIVFDNIIYQKALDKMIELGRPIVWFLSKKYQKNSGFNEISQGKKEEAIVTIIQEQNNGQVFDQIDNSSTEIVQYYVEKEKLENIKNFLQSVEKTPISNRVVWERTFDYFYKNEIE